MNRKIAESIESAIIMAVLLTERKEIDLSNYKDKKFMLTKFLGDFLKCGYAGVKYHWNKVAKMSIMEYYGQYRDRRAIYWQRNYDLRMKEIAFKLGYCNYSELIKQFKRRQKINLCDCRGTNIDIIVSM